MKHKHAEVLKAIADGKAVQWRLDGDDFWETLEKEVLDRSNPLTREYWQWRIAPETIMIGDMEVPQPCREAPPLDSDYYYPLISHTGLYANTLWTGDHYDLRTLAAGLVHLTREAAITHAKALIKISGGTYE
jgi:hypothetical protein